MISTELLRSVDDGPAPVGLDAPSSAREVPPERGIRTRAVGRSVEGRRIELAHRGPEPGEVRILVLAGQHGDEPWGRIAVRRWIARADDRAVAATASRPVTCLAVLDANPDGSRRNRRRNAHDIDLNRDHLLLEAPETRAIHETVRRYRPHLIVDVHNFPSRRRHLLARGWTIGADIQLAGATHPAIRTSMTMAEEDGLILRIRSDLASRGFTAVPYTLFRRSGKARPSTLRVRDARNSLSLRYGIPTVLLEGRDPGRKGPSQGGLRTAEAQFEALRSIEAWASEHSEGLLRGPPIPEAGESVPLEARWTENGELWSVPFERAESGEAVRVPWPRFAGELRVRSRASLPRAYAIRNDLTELHALLARHGITGDAIERSRSALVEPVRSWEGPRETGASGTVAHSVPPPAPFDLAGYTSYSVHQRAGRALSVWLEAGPRSGLAALRAEREPARAGTGSPILRVVLWDYPAAGLGSPGPARDHRSDRRRLEPLPNPFRWAFGPSPSCWGGQRKPDAPAARDGSSEGSALGPSDVRTADPLG